MDVSARTRHFGQHAALQHGMAPPSQVFVPVTAVGNTILDNGGDLIATCFTPQLAQRIAALLNMDAELS